ncbi:invasion protein [Thiomicrospira aerophila AL3]|uniref:Invasion protein n=1 Tax=Thiomicrospira aerophila AL3 TaxID=717772 RepID=W0DXM8_9GAMM|nr:SirB2 family protein [Thiomicrospira aerophila]AHF02038.1 invasion protein [Thiomicrospira aerophila AL3]
MYAGLLLLHKIAVLTSISVFFIRGLGVIYNREWVTRKPVKIVPHVIDTVLILSAVGIVLVTPFAFSDPWILMKTFGVLVYVALSVVVFKVAKSRAQRALFWVLNLAVLFFLVAVAVEKQVWPF